MAFLERSPQKNSVNHTALHFLPFVIFLLERERVFLPRFSLLNRELEVHGCPEHGQLFGRCSRTGGLAAPNAASNAASGQTTTAP